MQIGEIFRNATFSNFNRVHVATVLSAFSLFFFGTTNVDCVLHLPENFVLATAVTFRYRSPSGNSGLFNLWKNVPGDPLLFFETCCDVVFTPQQPFKKLGKVY